MNSKKALGGYFELELAKTHVIPHQQALRFRSARSAFLALLKVGKPSHVWLPRYICDAMLAPVRALDIAHHFYSISESFEIADDISLRDNDWVVHVNYFGICAKAQRNAIATYGCNRVICDNAQAFFSNPEKCVASLYSPRKFFGVPDGGMLVTDADVRQPTERDVISISRMSHLIMRLQSGPECGFRDFKIAETQFEALTPQAMSCISERLLGAIDIENVAMLRKSNFSFLHSHLSRLNTLEFRLDSSSVPLCYPFLASDKRLRDKLKEAKIFTATYWPEALSRSAENSFEHTLANHLIALPCDQRYDHSDMMRIITIVEEHFR